MTDGRKAPDEYLRVIREEQTIDKAGKLKIFFGYAAGVGKTYAMLKAAHAAANQGIDVVLGYIEPHARPQTAALTKGLKRLPVKETTEGGIFVKEFDIDAAIARKPQLILVDELAHTNASSCRHAKRYQDIEELLNNGIDVYTTVNVQHIESLNNTVASITGVLVKERIPDRVFDCADQVNLVDIEPQDLLLRLKAGEVYREEQAKRAVENFFTVENLTALREIALRRCADRMNLITEDTRVKNHADYHTAEHIMVCLSTSPSNAKIIRTGARMAVAFKSHFTAIFVETPGFAAISERDKKRLRNNMHLAEQLGAKVETVYGENVPFQIAEFAKYSGISKIVIGRNSAARRNIFSKPTLTEQLINFAPNLDIHIIPDSETAIERYKTKNVKKKYRLSFSLMDTLKSVGILCGATLIGLLFEKFGFTEVNIIMVYILGVLLTSVATSSRYYSLISSIVSVLVFNFFFTVPKYTLRAYDSGYPVTFLVMFVAALLSGSLAVRLKRNAIQSARAAFRTTVLFDTNQLLGQAKGRDEIYQITANQIIRLLGKDVVLYPLEGDDLGNPKIFAAADEQLDEIMISENERAVAAWVYKNRKHAGATTGTLASAKCLYLSIRTPENVYGVIGIAATENSPDTFENSILLSILGESALALENEHNAVEKEKAAIQAENERLRANLLRAISHDLRTPLTSISGNASNLLTNESAFDEETKHRLYTDIYDDSMWLINLVENLLSVTRLEDGKMKLHLSAELVDDVITEALKHINRKSIEHHITVDNQDDYLLAKMDAKLIVQIVINIVDNAIKYTQPGSEINIRSEKAADKIVISISDNGPGISDEMKPHVFDMFYSGANKVVDSRRSLGLGLSLCKSIVTAHDGEITVSDNKPSGTVFRFTLPAKEAHIHE